jgi:hypothetical protein
MIQLGSENGRRKITQNSIEVDAEKRRTKEKKKKTGWRVLGRP